MNKYISEVVDYLIEEYAESVIEETTKYATEKVGKFIDSFKTALKMTIHNEECVVLDMKLLTEISRRYRVNSSNGVAAMKVIKDNSNIVYLAYVKDRDLLPVEDNHYVVIKATALTPEVINLFKENKLVILK